MEHLLLRRKCSIFHNILENLTFQRHPKALMRSKRLTLYLVEMPFNTFAKRADPDQTALVTAARSESSLFVYGNMIYLILH